MQKIFYYPAVFRLKRLGTEKAVIVATLFVFLLTWFLHAYQWFWLRGTILFVPQDILFWLILGMLVVLNSLYEIRYGRTRALGKPVWTWRTGLKTAARTYATFWAICILWSFWTSDSLEDWMSLWSALRGPYTLEALKYPAAVLAVIALGSIPQEKLETAKTRKSADQAWMRERLVTFACLVALIGISVESIHSRIGTEVGTFVHSLRSGRLSRLDTAKLERGYYESLMSVDRFNSQLWEVYAKKPTKWLAPEGAGLKRFVGGFAQVELIPSFSSNTPYGVVSINQWGMRDKAYAAVPAPGTYRAALLGASGLMGWGVADGATFESLVEERLNRELVGTPYRSFELLNFGVPGYTPPQQLVSFEKALKLHPNAIYFVATGREQDRSAFYLGEVVRKKLDIPYPELRAIVAKSGVRADMDEAMATKLLLPYGRDILAYTYNYIAGRAREGGMTAVWIFLPQVQEGAWQEATPEAEQLARDAGFIVINMSDVYRGRDVESIRLAEWDEHPNTLGHQLIAKRLFAELVDKRAAIFDATAGHVVADQP
jgi:hypothetical protein